MGPGGGDKIRNKRPISWKRKLPKKREAFREKWMDHISDGEKLESKGGDSS